MKITIVTPDLGSGDVPLAKLYFDAFSNLAHQSKILAINPCVVDLSFIGRASAYVGRRLSRVSGANQKTEKILLRTIIGDMPDLVIFIRCENLSLNFLKEIRRYKSIILANIYPDNPMVIPGVITPDFYDWLAAFDVIFSSDDHVKKVFYQLGAKSVEWLPFAHDPKYHSAKSINTVDRQFYGSPIGYIGTYGQSQARWLKLLNQYGLKIWGNGWERIPKGDTLRQVWMQGYGIGVEMWKPIYSSSIIFNMCRAEHMAELSMKTFEIPAGGGLMLSNFTESQNAFFKNGIEAIYYNNIDDAKNLISYYLKNESVVEKIKQNAIRAVAKHTYTSRAKAIVEYVQTGNMTSFI